MPAHQIKAGAAAIATGIVAVRLPGIPAAVPVNVIGRTPGLAAPETLIATIRDPPVLKTKRLGSKE